MKGYMATGLLYKKIGSEPKPGPTRIVVRDPGEREGLSAKGQRTNARSPRAEGLARGDRRRAPLAEHVVEPAEEPVPPPAVPVAVNP
jgi:hypothetical protein